MGAGRSEKPSLHQWGCGTYLSHYEVVDLTLDLKVGDLRGSRKEEEKIYFCFF